MGSHRRVAGKGMSWEKPLLTDGAKGTFAGTCTERGASRQSGRREQISKGCPARLTRSSWGAPQGHFWGPTSSILTGRTPSSTLIQDRNFWPARISTPGQLLWGTFENGENTNTVSTLYFLLRA